MSCKTDSTHHHACDCREEYWEGREKYIQKLEKALKKISESIDFVEMNVLAKEALTSKED